MYTIDVRLLIENDDPTFVLDQVSRIVGVTGAVQLASNGHGFMTPDIGTLLGNGRVMTMKGDQVPWDGRTIYPDHA